MTAPLTRYAGLSGPEARIILSNFRGMTSGRVRNKPNCFLVCDLFGVGSTRASELCRAWDIAPEGFDCSAVK